MFFLSAYSRIHLAFVAEAITGGKILPGRVAVDEFETVGGVIVDAEIIHQSFNRKIERAGDDDLFLSDFFRLRDQFGRAVENRGLENVFKKFFGEIAQPVFGFAFVALEKKFVENIARI